MASETSLRFVRRPPGVGQAETPIYDVLLGDIRIGQVSRSSDLTYYRWRGISVVRGPSASGRRTARQVHEMTRRAAAAALLRVYLDRP